MNKFSNKKQEGKRSSLQFWKEMIEKVAQIDFQEPIPEISPRFIHIWARHYFKIASMEPLQEPILEVGAGYGVLATGLGKLSMEKIITTEHPSRAYLSNSEYHQFLKSHKVELVSCDLLKGLPFANKSFRQIYFCDVIEHLPPTKMIFALREIHRVLMPGGKLILSTPNLNRLSNFFRFLAGHSVNPPLEVGMIGETYGHIRELAPKELKNMLLKVGLIPEKWEYITNPYFAVEAFGEDNIFSLKKARLINGLTRILIRILPHTGDEIFVTAHKQ